MIEFSKSCTIFLKVMNWKPLVWQPITQTKIDHFQKAFLRTLQNHFYNLPQSVSQIHQPWKSNYQLNNLVIRPKLLSLAHFFPKNLPQILSPRIFCVLPLSKLCHNKNCQVTLRNQLIRQSVYQAANSWDFMSQRHLERHPEWISLCSTRERLGRP